jgi:propionyl-CoA synthetase
VAKGDRVVIYMPMVPEAAIVAMLACARLRRDPFGGVRRFCRQELATRIDDARPKADRQCLLRHRAGAGVAYKPLLDAAIEHSRHKPDARSFCNAEQHRCDLIEGGISIMRSWLPPMRRRKVACSRWLPPIRSISSYTSGTTG